MCVARRVVWRVYTRQLTPFSAGIYNARTQNWYTGLDSSSPGRDPTLRHCTDNSTGNTARSMVASTQLSRSALYLAQATLCSSIVRIVLGIIGVVCLGATRFAAWSWFTGPPCGSPCPSATPGWSTKTNASNELSGAGASDASNCGVAIVCMCPRASSGAEHSKHFSFTRPRGAKNTEL